MQEGDIDALVGIIDQNYPEEAYEPKARKEIADAFSKGPIKPAYLVVEDLDGAPIAFGGYIQSWMDYHIYELFWVNVAKHFQGKGIGTHLVQALINAITVRDAQAELICITTQRQKFYEQLGFTAVHILAKGYAFMTKQLKTN